jgi:hypothetical protein
MKSFIDTPEAVIKARMEAIGKRLEPHIEAIEKIRRRALTKAERKKLHQRLTIALDFYDPSKKISADKDNIKKRFQTSARSLEKALPLVETFLRGDKKAQEALLFAEDGLTMWEHYLDADDNSKVFKMDSLPNISPVLHRMKNLKNHIKWFVALSKAAPQSRTLVKSQLRKQYLFLEELADIWYVYSGKPASTTTDPVTSERGGPFARLAQDLVRIVDPSASFSGENIRRALMTLKAAESQ